MFLLLCLVAPKTLLAQGTFTTFQAPDAGAGILQGTGGISVNSAGVIAGAYSDANNVAHGFVRAVNGTITEFDAPGAGTGLTQGTFPLSVNDAGTIAGYYSDVNRLYHGFVRAASGTFTAPIDAPGVNTTGHNGTSISSINSSGDVTGFYRDANLVYHGFVLPAGGTISTFDAANVGATTYAGTNPVSINAAGEITGWYKDTSLVSHGFVRAVNGTITTFDVAGAGGTGSSHMLVAGTMPLSINAAGEIAGSYRDASSGACYGFVRAADGTIATFDAPGASLGTGMFQGTVAGSINDLGVIAGAYGDTNSVVHGFMRSADGTITTFDAPGAGTSGLLVYGTAGFSINLSGVIAGTYTDPTSVIHGFLLTPASAATTTTVTSTPNPAVYGEQVTLTAQVASSAGTPPNGENVSFLSGTTTLGTGPLSGGKASLTTTALPVGTASITAVYSGDSNFSSSTSAAVSQVVSKASSSITLNSSLNPSNFGQSVTFTATVTGQFGGIPTGSVTFSNGSTSLGAASLSSNSAGLATTALPLGTDSITAVYSGDANFSGSTSNTVSQAVNQSPASSVALLFVPMTPCRLVDTRNATGPFGGPSLAGETSRSFVIPNSACGVPSTAAAYSINVTVVPRAGLGYLTVWPTGVTQPNASTLNSDGRVKANAAIVPAGAGGAISVYATDTTDVVLDINGYFVPATSTTALAFYPLTPCRVADTRNPTGTLGGPSLIGNQSRAFPIQSSACNIPSSAQAYSLNFTAVPQAGLGYLSAYPAGQTWPGVSTLNVSPNNPVVANAAIVPVGTGGAINVLGSSNTDVVIDINGYFAPPNSASGGQALFTVTPCRVLDTRSSSGSFTGLLPVNVTGSSCGIPSSAEAFVLNATVVPTGGLGYLTLWPENEAQPVVSTLNADDGVIASNMAIVPTTNGSIDAFSSSATQLILDISGYFAPSSSVAAQLRVTAKSAANNGDTVGLRTLPASDQVGVAQSADANGNPTEVCTSDSGTSMSCSDLEPSGNNPTALLLNTE
jgi:hypothetical protein